jgi:hypothetical protein
LLEQDSDDTTSLVIDHEAKIDPNAFAVLWEEFSDIVEFKCLIRSLHSDHIRLEEFVSHLHSRGFFIVASGSEDDDPIRVYLFCSGYMRSNATKPQFFFAEINIRPVDGDNYQSSYALHCISKCSEPSYCSLFLGEFHLSILFETQG